jgi:hypothetical protein
MFRPAALAAPITRSRSSQSTQFLQLGSTLRHGTAIFSQRRPDFLASARSLAVVSAWPKWKTLAPLSGLVACAWAASLDGTSAFNIATTNARSTHRFRPCPGGHDRPIRTAM